jgi:U3 small nucleolar RNA-associated protein 11
LQQGVHIKDRGNVALPVDIVKVLKTQDENYVRTMRSAGRKVGQSRVSQITAFFLPTMTQKIDKIKNQLTAFVDLVKPSDLQMDKQDLEVLNSAGILAGPSKGTGRKHIVFVDNEEQGTLFNLTRSEKPNSWHQTLQQNSM